MRPALWTLGLALLAAAPAAAQAVCAGGQTFDADALAARGAGRLHEVLRWAEAVHPVTVDGFDAAPVVRAAGTGRVRWLVDGLPVATASTLEPDGTEPLPVALAEVARVTVCPGPGLAAGVWGGPWVEVITRRPARYASAAVDYGNETGDPGPARYLDRDLPNVDRWGPDAELALVATEALRAAVRVRSFYPTDTTMAARMDAALVPGRFPKRLLRAGALHAQAAGWTLRAGGALADDLPHLPLLGREVPVHRRAAQASAGGPLGQWREVRFGARLHAAHQALTRPTWSALALDPAWTETAALAGAEATHGRPSRQIRAGLQAEAHRWDGPGLGPRVWTVWRATGQAVQAPDSLTMQTSTLALTVSGSDIRLAGGVERRHTLSGGGHVSLGVNAMQRAGREQPTLADALVLGYTGLGGPLDEVARGFRLPREEAIARLAAARPLGGGMALDAVVEATAARETLLHPRFGAPDSTGMPSVGTGLAEAAGRALAARGGATWTTDTPAGALVARAFGSVHASLGGTAAWREAADRLPAWRAGVEATLRPDARLALWGRADAHAATRWAGYPAPDVPAAVLVDLGMTYAAAGGRLRGSLAGRNVLGGVLGTEERWHPLGAELAPRLFVRVEARW